MLRDYTRAIVKNTIFCRFSNFYYNILLKILIVYSSIKHFFTCTLCNVFQILLLHKNNLKHVTSWISTFCSLFFFLSLFIRFLTSSFVREGLHKFGSLSLLYYVYSLFQVPRFTLIARIAVERSASRTLSREFISCHRIFKRRITVLSSNFIWNNPRAFPPKREDRVPFGFYTANTLSRGKSRLKARTVGEFALA